MKCTGACCSGFIINTTLGALRGQLDRSLMSNTPDIERARLLRIIRPLPPSDDGEKRFKCAAWDPETKRCLDYEQRPEMCSTFPYGTVPCWVCGARTDAEARSVELMVVR